MRTNRVVFVGSTFGDLELHRRGLIDALHDLVWLKVMESRGAAAGDALENCLRWVRDSDVYVAVLGMCYGSRDPRSGRSFTEHEYDEAMRLKLPCLIYMIDEERHPLLPSRIDRGKDAEDLARFKEKVTSANHRGLFRSPEHLQYQVTRDIVSLFGDMGWLTSPAAAPAPTEPPQEESGPPREEKEWRIQLCAWGSAEGVLDLSRSLSPQGSDEPDIAASVLVSRFGRGDFADLRRIVTLRPEIRNAMQSYFAVRDIDEDALAEDIRSASDSLHLRMLIDVAGLARARGCTQAICEQVLLHGRRRNEELRALRYEMRPFLDVAAEALGRMPQSSQSILREHLERARTSKRWHAKNTFEKALRRLRGESSQTSE